MKNPRPLVIALLVIGFFALGWWIAFYRGGNRPGNAGQQGRQAKSPTAEAPAASEDAAELDQSPQAVLARLFAKLRLGGITPAELANFRKNLLNADPVEAMAAIRKFLATGQDALTGEAFTFVQRGGGSLSGAPTFRVLMLDLLGRIARESHSPEAGVASRELLQNKTSADEWALALRNVAWATPSDQKFLADKTRELLAYQPWRLQPSAGYYEAFDVIVYLGDATFIPSLREMLVGEDPSLQTGAAVALDNLAAMAPLAAMNFLNTNRGELSQKPFLRADYFGKADFSDTVQRVAVETYLSRPDVATQEKIKMLSVVASPGTFAADNLLTAIPEADIPPQRTAALQRSVSDWLKTNRYPELVGPLLQLQGRLEEP